MQYGWGGHRFMKVFHKIPVFFEGWLPLVKIIKKTKKEEKKEKIPDSWSMFCSHVGRSCEVKGHDQLIIDQWYCWRLWMQKKSLMIMSTWSSWEEVRVGRWKSSFSPRDENICLKFYTFLKDCMRVEKRQDCWFVKNLLSTKVYKGQFYGFYVYCLSFTKY